MVNTLWVIQNSQTFPVNNYWQAALHQL